MPPLISKAEIIEIINSKTDLAQEVMNRISAVADGTSKPILKMHPLYQMVYSTMAVEGDICNGGFYQYYGNSTAQEFNAMGIEGFRLIGAHKTADILLKVYNTILEQSFVFRMDYKFIGIQDAFNSANDDYNQIHIDEYDTQFYAVIDEENITQLRVEYIVQAAMNGWIE